MNTNIHLLFEKFKTGNKEERYEAYQDFLNKTEQKVDFAYEIWDELLVDLTNKDGHIRSGAAQFLANLVKSDPENRILSDFPKVWAVTKDDKFVTARHSLQVMWKIGIAGKPQKELVMNALMERFKTEQDEKNHTLIRNDIIQNMKYLYDYYDDDTIKQTALDLIETVDEDNYKKKYLRIFK